MIEIIALILALVVAYVLVTWYPDQTATWFGRAMAARRIILGVVAVIVAFVFLGTGNIVLMAVGFLMFVYLGLFLFYESPHQEVLSWLGS